MLMGEIRNFNIEILNKSEFTNVQMLETREGVSCLVPHHEGTEKHEYGDGETAVCVISAGRLSLR